MSQLPFQTLLRRGPSTTTTLLHILSTSKASTPSQPQAAAITRAFHNISRHTIRSTRHLPQRQQHQLQRFFLPRRRPYSTAPRKPPSSNPPSSTKTHQAPHQAPLHTPPSPSPESLSLSARLRKLSREYGWSAFGIYLLLSALDFPFCFLAVRSLGADTVGHYEHLVIGSVSGFIPEGVKDAWAQGKDFVMAQWRSVVGNGNAPEASSSVTQESTADFGKEVIEAEAMNRREDASIWTQLALAYAIHKSFIFVRVPLTVAVTPRVVKFLRGLGWDIGKRRPKAVKVVKVVK